MKSNAKLILLITLAVAGSAACIIAQDSGNNTPRRRGQMGPPPGHRPPPPIVAVLDANHDGVIDADEIANASTALLKLDKNGDGQLTPEELRPPRRQNNDNAADRPPFGPEGENLPADQDGPPMNSPEQN